MDEFGLIRRYLAPLAGPAGLDLLDDAAVMPGHPGQDLVYTKDLMIGGVHFLPDQPPGDVAKRLARVNLSDLAAMGARPFGYLLGLALPKPIDEAWLAAFTAGLRADQSLFSWSLLGGDTTAGSSQAVLSLTAIGVVDSATALLRRGARVGDRVYVSGVIGDGVLGLTAMTETPDGIDGPIASYRAPEPRLALGQALRGVASACVDVSDGLVADAGHIATASDLHLSLQAAAVPLSAAGRTAVDSGATALSALLSGGDDYELVFTAPQDRHDAVMAASRACGVPVTPIGTAEAGAGVAVFGADGTALTFTTQGYRHS